ncbi:glycosyl transferase family 21-domain-containing protein [Gilbertella persicaria]|uniref:glycosyl transferase family 21-domain-containing protein n=1 Tax=Gilbertella persicaria TaxID=101096 RepID=UPI00222060A3|nr:glycosyl transferase family 21-domain-containing protein [Gilbertella persicaria]KAI8075880.1 glycosyl transferase family 21-domain-containing protein [Gilbertella persicaria]
MELSTVTTAFYYLLVIWYGFMFFLSLFGQYIGQSRYRNKPKPKSSKLSATEAEGVSIIRPLKGVDLELETNLRSSFVQNYSKFEIIFSVASAQDAAIEVVRKLQQEYHHIDSRLIIGDHQVGINPKINNMIESYRTAKYDIVWVLDSNVHIDKDTLGRSVDKLLMPGIGLVHHLPIAVQPASYAAQIEQTFLDTNHAKMYLAINAVGIASCVMGKSNLYRRSDLDRVGGLESFGKYMAEDNIIGEALWYQGLRHAMSADTACQALGSISLKGYCGRRARWVRLRKYIVTAATLVEPMTESILCGLMGAYGFHALFGLSMSLFLVFHWTWWFINDYFLYQILIHSSLHSLDAQKPLPFLYFLRAWVSREMLALPLYLYAMAGTKISWRDQEYRCISDGTAVAIQTKSIEDVGLLSQSS